MTSKIIVKPRGWTATLDESVCFVDDNGERFSLMGLGGTPEDARIDLAAQIAGYSTGDLKTALGELATDLIIHAALKRAEHCIVFYEEMFKTAKHKEGLDHLISVNRHAAEALRNLISSMKEHTQ